MRTLLIILAQVVVSFLIAGAVMPALIATMPAAQDDHVGRLVVFATIGVLFVLVRLAWPRGKQQ